MKTKNTIEEGTASVIDSRPVAQPKVKPALISATLEDPRTKWLRPVDSVLDWSDNLKYRVKR
jgi:hypothetical protein